MAYAVHDRQSQKGLSPSSQNDDDQTSKQTEWIIEENTKQSVFASKDQDSTSSNGSAGENAPLGGYFRGRILACSDHDFFPCNDLLGAGRLAILHRLCVVYQGRTGHSTTI